MQTQSFHCLGETSVEEFLAQYWQKKPLLIRNAFAEISPPISAEELAGLACEEQVNARLVIENAASNHWQVEFGPFDESRFKQLPKTHWSLLVSDVEKHCPETRYLINAFRFIPDWRVDDLMISYAPEGGSVGPHTDAYDVFLLQLSGHRLWQISEQFDTTSIEGIDLSILKSFTAEQEWLLNPGDMLYLPPNVAHHGVAQNHGSKDGEEQHCMTASIGFRAPSLKTLSSDYIHYLNENVHDATRYRDKNPVLQKHHAEITQQTVDDFIDYLKQGMSLERKHVTRWLGQYCSDNKAFEDINHSAHDELQPVTYLELLETIDGNTLIQSPYSHFLFSYEEDEALLFVDGISYQVGKEFAECICTDDTVNFQQLSEGMTEIEQSVLLDLFNSGAIIIA